MTNRLRIRVLLIATLLMSTILISAQLCAQDIACTATTAISSQARSAMKHRAPGDAGAATQTVTVAQVLAWAAPANIATPSTRRSGTAIDNRENQAFTITGDLWRVIIEDNDCDFHFEITTPGQPKTAARIIVEVPQGDAYAEVRSSLLKELTANGYELAVAKSITLDDPLRVTVTGFAFYDAAHYSKKNPKKGHSHGTVYVGTLWELHPVWAVVFADSQ
jgi:hypothetical protein